MEQKNLVLLGIILIFLSKLLIITSDELPEVAILIKESQIPLIMERKQGINLDIYIHIRDHQVLRYYNSPNLWELCLYVNITECECFPSTTITVNAKCMPEQPFWFSIQGKAKRLSSSHNIELNNYSNDNDNNNDITDKDNHLSSKFVDNTEIFLGETIYVPKKERKQEHYRDSNMITLVLPLTARDLKRAHILFNSLFHAGPLNIVAEMILIFPDDDLSAMILKVEQYREVFTFPLTLIQESTLFEDSHILSRRYEPYCLQMALKLLIAKKIHTKYYLTLDADVIMLKDPSLIQLIPETFLSGQPMDANEVGMQTNTNKKKHRFVLHRALYENESRRVHSDWWIASARMLGLILAESKNNAADKSNDDDMAQKEAILAGDGFSVTPALLSTYGSLLVLNRIRKNIIMSSGTTSFTTSTDNLNQKAIEESTLLDAFYNPFTRWSEYTLYRLGLDSYPYANAFRMLHHAQSYSQYEAQAETIRQEPERIVADTQEISVSSTSEAEIDIVTNTSITSTLHCYNVWWQGDLPWNSVGAFNSNCLFSVVQSSAVGIDELDVLYSQMLKTVRHKENFK